jgi:hypothetical protein
MIEGVMPKSHQYLNRFSGVLMSLLVGGQRRIVCEFDYDGRALQFRTLGIRQTQVRPLEDIAKVKDWSGRGGPIGYRLVFRGSGKVYLYYPVANSITLANQLRRDAKG